MSDNTNIRGGIDRKLISLSQPHEVRYWTETLGVSEDELRQAIEKVGNSTEAVRKTLQ